MKIYLACFPVSWGRHEDVIGYALAEDGVGLASHLSSHEEWAKHDMGLTSDWKHDHYAKCYPDGYELEWIDNADTDERWLKAIALNQEKKNAESKTTQMPKL